MDSNRKRTALTATAIAPILFFVGGVSWADDEEGVTVWVSNPNPRLEISIGPHSWPALADLDVASEGSFDEIGFNLNLGIHMPVRRYGRSELLAGIDLGLLSNESDIRFRSDTLVARNGYITPSVKWVFGRGHRYSLDAGLGYYLQDVAEVAGEYPAYWETQLWEDGAVGGYLGGTIDFANGDPTNNNGIMLSCKIHFVEFGSVQDEEGIFPETLGRDAGNLSGPIYTLQLGYRWR